MKSLRILSSILCFSFPLAAQEPPAREKVEKLMAAGRASQLNDSDNVFGQEVIETLAGLLLKDPEQARLYFLKARAQVAADRAAKVTSKPGQGGQRHRSVSALGAALGGALERVEKVMQDGDPRLPKAIGAVAAMLAANEGCGVEGNISVGTHLGWMLIKVGRMDDGKFNAQRLVEQVGPELKAEWLPVLLGPARGLGWGFLRNDEAQQKWLHEYALQGEYRDFARLVLTAARISSQEKDAANKPRTGILERAKLPEEQLWLVNLLEQKTVPPAALAACAAEVLRVWPTAEPPLRYACAGALAAAWAADVPANAVEATWITESLGQLIKAGKAPEDEGFAVAVKALLAGWEKRMELNRTPLYGWGAQELQSNHLTGWMILLTRTLGAEAAEKLLAQLIAEAAPDASLGATLRVSESLQRLRLYAEAAKVIASITPEQEKHEEVNDDRRMHVAIKRYHVALDAAAAAGRDEAVKATIALLTEKLDDPTAWTAAAWSWRRLGLEMREDGNHEEALRRYCVSCVLAHAADKLAHDTHGNYQPPSEGEGREELTALKFHPDRIAALRTPEGVNVLLDSFDNAWKPLPDAVRQRLMAGAEAR